MSKHVEGKKVIRNRQHGFTKDPSCLTTLMACHHGVAASADKERAADVTYLEFCKAFDMVHFSILTCKLERYGFDG